MLRGIRNLAFFSSLVFWSGNASGIPINAWKCNRMQRAIEQARRLSKVPPNEPGIKQVEADPELAESRNVLMREQIWSNARFPQMNTATILRLVMTYYTKPLEARKMFEAPSQEELNTVGNAMNKLHKACRVQYRTKGHAEAKRRYEVTENRLWDLIFGFNLRAFNATHKVAMQIMEFHYGKERVTQFKRDIEIELGPGAKRRIVEAQSVDAIFKDSANFLAANDLIEIGRIAQNVLESREMEDLFRGYREVLRDRPEDRTARGAMVRDIDQRLRAAVKQSILERLPHLEPIADELAQVLVIETRGSQ